MPPKRRKGVRSLFRAAEAERLRRLRNESATRRRPRGVLQARILYVVTDRSIVKVGITGNLERRLSEHRKQGLWKVVYVLRTSRFGEVRRLELEWKAFVQSRPHVSITRTVLPDGYTEAAVLCDEVKEFIDRLVGKSESNK